MLEVYIDNIIVKSREDIDHTVHLRKLFDQARRCKIRFNPKKFTFNLGA